MLKKKLKYKALNNTFKLKKSLSKHVKWRARNPLVLVFHGVVSKDPLKFNSRHIDIDYFNKIITFLKSNGQIISLKSALSGKYNNKGRNFVLSFDDGYLNNFHNAIPILVEKQIPASICYNSLDNDRLLWPDLMDLCSNVQSDISIENNGEKLKLKSNLNKIRKKLLHSNKAEHEKIRSQLLLLEGEICKKDDLKEFWQRMNFEQLKEIHSNDLFELIPHGHAHISYKDTPSSYWINDFKAQYEIHTQEFGKTDTFAFPFAFWEEENINYLYDNFGIKHFLAVDPSPYLYKSAVIVPRLNVHQHLDFEVFKHFIARGNFE